MSDLVWFVATGILFVLLGLLFIRLGLQIWKKQRTDLIISYHSDKVKAENREAYCKLFGIGILVMGTGFLLSGICTAFVRSAFVFVPMAVGSTVGIVMLTVAIIKYNR